MSVLSYVTTAAGRCYEYLLLSALVLTVALFGAATEAEAREVTGEYVTEDFHLEWHGDDEVRETFVRVTMIGARPFNLLLEGKPTTDPVEVRERVEAEIGGALDERPRQVRLDGKNGVEVTLTQIVGSDIVQIAVRQGRRKVSADLDPWQPIPYAVQSRVRRMGVELATQDGQVLVKGRAMGLPVNANHRLRLAGMPR